ncbi:MULTISPECIES: hypothetical protein [Haloarcula]|uniref:Uncharacterized protein n=1 Tax=Haloarcula argentinensis TaxID=43776 RepID=A0A830FI32_HALAR|nr:MULTISPECIES: hypothetical protein [Haloarcula]MDQ2074724.1 hypothetical protein [Haloarcula sp. H-GB4]GGM52350.1 hypothetical protein GCM10009006_36910 [Haloarcula argentinensis]
MPIPEEVEDKLDADPAWAVQHADIIQVMDETSKSKPWSRYMIQQHLDSDPAKKTVQDRLDELVELGVLERYKYSNLTLYDLAYDPILTDGGRLKDANLIELATLRDRTGARDLAAGAILSSFAFLALAVLAEMTTLASEFRITSNFYADTAIILYVFGFLIIFILGSIQKVEPWLTSVELPW